MTKETRKERLLRLRKAYVKALCFNALVFVVAALITVASVVFLNVLGFVFAASLGAVVAFLLLSLPYVVLLWTHASFWDFFGPAVVGKNQPVKREYMYVSSYVSDFFLRCFLYLAVVALVLPLTALSVFARLTGLIVVCVKLRRLNKRETEPASV